jgi:predicted O-methyltransferase YrrM
MRFVRLLTRAEALGVVAGVAVGILTALAAWAGLTEAAAILPVAIVVAVVVATGTRNRHAQRKLVATAAERQTRKLDDRMQTLKVDLRKDLREATAAAAFSAMDLPFPVSLGGFALDYEAAAMLAREVAVNRPATVVELGSGTSTLIIGLQLQRSGSGHLYSLEHDPVFAQRTMQQVRALGLEQVVSVLVAPLAPTTLGPETFTWYAVPDEVAALARIDLLLVDGPPQYTDRAGTPRYPALPVLGDRLVPGSIVVVDDAFRDAEKRMLERWLADRPDLASETIATKHGVAVLRVGPLA